MVKRKFIPVYAGVAARRRSLYVWITVMWPWWLSLSLYIPPAKTCSLPYYLSGLYRFGMSLYHFLRHLQSRSFRGDAQLVSSQAAPPYSCSSSSPRSIFAITRLSTQSACQSLGQSAPSPKYDRVPPIQWLLSCLQQHLRPQSLSKLSSPGWVPRRAKLFHAQSRILLCYSSTYNA